MQDDEIKKQVLGGLSKFLGDRLTSRIQPKSQPKEMEIDMIKLEPSHEGSTEGDDDFHEDLGTNTGNADRSSFRGTSIAHGESPVADVPDSDPDKEQMELAEDGEGLGDHEKEDLEKIYGEME